MTHFVSPLSPVRTYVVHNTTVHPCIFIYASYGNWTFRLKLGKWITHHLYFMCYNQNHTHTAQPPIIRPAHSYSDESTPRTHKLKNTVRHMVYALIHVLPTEKSETHQSGHQANLRPIMESWWA
jgi:hypothetical protein